MDIGPPPLLQHNHYCLGGVSVVFVDIRMDRDCFSVKQRILTQSDRLVDQRYLCSYADQIHQFFHIVIVHSNAAAGYRMADGRWVIRAVDAVAWYPQADPSGAYRVIGTGWNRLQAPLPPADGIISRVFHPVDNFSLA